MGPRSQIKEYRYTDKIWLLWNGQPQQHALVWWKKWETTEYHNMGDEIHLGIRVM